MADIEAIKRIYQEEHCLRDFPQDLYLHLTYGHVIVTPSSILMGRPIRHDATYDQICDISHKFRDPDTWMVWLAVGATPRDFICAAPYPLRFVAWERKNRIRFYDFATLLRRTEVPTLPLQGRSDADRRSTGSGDAGSGAAQAG